MEVQSACASAANVERVELVRALGSVVPVSRAEKNVTRTQVTSA